MPPAPIWAVISYGPRRIPGPRGIWVGGNCRANSSAKREAARTGSCQGAITGWAWACVRSVRRHETFELVEPVQHDDEARRARIRCRAGPVIRHEEALVVERDVVRAPGP